MTPLSIEHVAWEVQQVLKRLAHGAQFLSVEVFRMLVEIVEAPLDVMAFKVPVIPHYMRGAVVHGVDACNGHMSFVDVVNCLRPVEEHNAGIIA